ncbi:hypothetical protein AZ024_000392, partial [Escherichia coli]
REQEYHFQNHHIASKNRDVFPRNPLYLPNLLHQK